MRLTDPQRRAITGDLDRAHALTRDSLIRKVSPSSAPPSPEAPRRITC